MIMPSAPAISLQCISISGGSATSFGISPAGSKGRLDVKAIREPIEIDGVAAKQGDYLLGDEDGVVIIPQEIAEQAIAAAREKVSGENTVREELAAGVPVAEVFRKHGIL